ncbi:MAG: deoxynucleoside kinase [Chloroflexota bacterium]
MKRFVVVAGNIASGKTTLTQSLSNRLGWEAFLESVDENPYLADFYHDMNRWSFHSQIFFLSRRLVHHRQLLDRPTSVIQDRSVYEDAEIFARNLALQGIMSERDYDVYRDLYLAVISVLRPPDLVVYLRTSVPTLLERISQRARSFEQNIDPDYLDRLNLLYEEWIEGFDLCPILTIPSDKLDFAYNKDHLSEVIRLIQNELP